MPQALTTFRLAAGTTLVQASPWHSRPVTLSSPGLEVMTDLTAVKAASIAPDQALARAEQLMIWQGVRMLFVVNEMPELLGLISSTDLRGERPMKLVAERGLHHDEINVADVMTPLEQLDAVDIGDMRTATVATVIATLRRFGRNHLLVVQAMPGLSRHEVRGVISRAQIERQLGQTIDMTPVASSFAEVERALV